MKTISTKGLGIVQPDTGIMSNGVKMYAMLVENLGTYFEHYDDTDEELSKVVRVSFDEIDNLIISGKIVCSYTLSSLYVILTFLTMYTIIILVIIYLTGELKTLAESKLYCFDPYYLYRIMPS